MAIRNQLQRYMTFAAKVPPEWRLARGHRGAAAEIFGGESRVPLERARVRLVAYNREHGQYTTTEKQGNSSRTVTHSFTHDVGGIVLFEQFLPQLPARVSVSQYLTGEIDFTPMFDALYPPHKVGPEHGLSIKLEAQLLHPDFVDHDVELDPGDLACADFYRSIT